MPLAKVQRQDLEVLGQHFDLLWLMGVWRRSPAARRVALSRADLHWNYDAALPGWTEADVDGSPYAVCAYELDSALGGPGDLAAFRDRLHAAGVRLVVDFVANHLAMDHPWTTSYPDRFVRCPPEQSHSRAGEFFESPAGERLLHGRDPNFPPWEDTAQVNIFSEDAREALIADVLAIAQVADGVRCDMAMLSLSDVFAGAWGWALAGTPRPAREFWAELISGVKAAHPGFLFIAEAYWGLETPLLELGFDYAYDKRLYDLMLGGSAVETRRHLSGSGRLLHRAVRFTENHDEARAATAFGAARSRAAAAAAMTLPGLRLVHDGQMEGKRIRVPVQLVRAPDEPVDEDMVRFYGRLLSATDAPVFHEGTWLLLTVEPEGPPGASHESILAWAWTDGPDLCLTVWNQSGTAARGRLVIELPHWQMPDWVDLMEPDRPVAAGETGVALELTPWEARIIGLRASSAT